MMLFRKLVIFIIIFILLINCSGQKISSDLTEIHGSTMGTTYMVKIVKNDELNSIRTNEQTITAEIEILLKIVNQRMSTWIKNSEISLFNQYGETGWFEVSADTAAVIAESLRVSEISKGAFDITVGSLINLWGFGPGVKERQIPDEKQIKNLMEKIGYQKLSVRQLPPSVKKEDPGISCDFSAIAKGFGVDKVAEYLDSKGFKNYLVEIGGEIKTKGKNHKGKIWRVGIAAPDGSPSYKKVLLLKNTSMATSGDYHNYFEKDGIRYSHTIDPTTGRPITHKLVSVTVIHTSCMKADALATAINVMGPEKGYKLAVKEKFPVYMITREKNIFIEKMTPQFMEILAKNQKTRR